MKSTEILPLRHQAKIRNRWLKERLETILPAVMDREGFDMWIVTAREYNEDPVIMSLLPEPMMSARRRTILVFYKRPGVEARVNSKVESAMEPGGVAGFRVEPGAGSEQPDCADPAPAVENLIIARSGVVLEDLYQAAWPLDEPDQWQALKQVVEQRDPKSIGINISKTFAFGDGLTYTEYMTLMETLGPKYQERAESAERLAVGWLETRTPDEIRAYTGIVRICHQIVEEVFSRRVILPGVTTPSDVAWWMRQRIHDMGLNPWFQPSVDAQRSGAGFADSDLPILPGDLLHCDVGFYYLGLASDIQQNAYVLKPGEEAAPAGLVSALATGNRMQDIVMGQMARGRTGNEILRDSLNEAKAEGIKGSVYCHPIGYHGHAAGPTIGLWDRQEGVPGQGDYELFDDTCHSLELNIRQAIPEWNGQEVRMALEEDIVYTGGEVYLLDGRQKRLHLI